MPKQINDGAGARYFGGIQLPEWAGVDPPEPFYELFALRRAHDADPAVPFTTRQENEYALWLMRWSIFPLSIHDADLRHAGFDVCDFAAELVQHMLRKTLKPSFNLQVRNIRGLLKVLNLAFRGYMLDRLAKHRDPTIRESEFNHTRTSGFIGIRAPIESALDTEVDDLRAQLLAAEEEICRDAVTTVSAREREMIYATFRLLVGHLFEQHDMLSYWQLPTEIQNAISVEQHALISTRVNRRARWIICG